MNDASLDSDLGEKVDRDEKHLCVKARFLYDEDAGLPVMFVSWLANELDLPKVRFGEVPRPRLSDVMLMLDDCHVVPDFTFHNMGYE